MKRRTIVLVVAVGTVLGMAGCATSPKADVDAFEAHVLDTWERYSEYMNEGNVDDWLALWHPDGVQLPPGVPAFEGKSEITTSITTQHSTSDFEEFTIVNREVEVQGNLGFARGNYSFIATPKAGGDSASFQGKYLTIFKRQADGSWKIYRDCFNANE